MNPIRLSVIVLILSPVFTVPATLADSSQKPYSVQKHMGAPQQPLPTIKGGAHGKRDPHSRLTPEKHVQVALQHKAEGRMGEAFATLNTAIRNNPFSAELFAVRGSFYLERSNVSAALKDFESALGLAPDSAAILTNRAQAYRHFGRIAEALHDLNRAIELNPDLMAAHFNRGSIHYSSEDFELALKDFDSCIAIDPHAAGPYFNRASARDALGDRKGAIEDIERFIEVAGNGAWRDTALELLDKWQAEPVASNGQSDS